MDKPSSCGRFHMIGSQQDLGQGAHVDETQGCCKFCGADLEPGLTCEGCLSVGLDPTRYSLEEAAALRTNAFLMNIESHKEKMIPNDEMVIGRHEANPLRLVDPYVSRYHARIIRKDHTYYIEDLGSTNGTLLNGEDVSSLRPLRHGDHIRIGKSEFIFVAPRPARVPSQ